MQEIAFSTYLLVRQLLHPGVAPGFDLTTMDVHFQTSPLDMQVHHTMHNLAMVVALVSALRREQVRDSTFFLGEVNADGQLMRFKEGVGFLYAGRPHGIDEVEEVAVPCANASSLRKIFNQGVGGPQNVIKVLGFDTVTAVLQDLELL